MTARCRWCGETRERELVAVAGRHVCRTCWRARTQPLAYDTVDNGEPEDAVLRRAGAATLPGLD